MGTIQSINPATGVLLAEFSSADEAAVRASILRCRVAQSEWGRRSFRERGKILLQFRERIRVNLDSLAHLISEEGGKPLVESISSDLEPVMELITFFAANAARLLRREKIWLGKWSLLGRSSAVEFFPVGVVGVIAPWNYPFSIPAGQIVMALLAGNGVIFKPSEFTPLIGKKIGELFVEAGLPADLLQVVIGDGATGAAVVNAGLDRIVFTGSVPTGKKVMAAASAHLTPVVLELGGKDPMIVLKDADLDLAASAAVWGAFTNSGQVCASVERLYVDQSIAKRFTELCVEKTRGLKQGNPLDVNTDVGVMNNEPQLKKVAAQVSAAIGQGAKALIGGAAPAGKGYFYPPTILVDVAAESDVMRDETFGPVLPIASFKTEEEAIRLANDSEFGLTASIWTKDLRRGEIMARQIQAGTVMVNENVYTYALGQTPWGGPKASGLGRVHGRLGLLEFVEPRHIHINRFSRMKDLWWFSYSEARLNLLKGMVDLFFAPGIWRRLKGLAKVIVNAFRAKNL